MSRFDTVTVYLVDGEVNEHSCSVARVSDGVLYVQDSDCREHPTCYPLMHVKRWTRQ